MLLVLPAFAQSGGEDLMPEIEIGMKTVATGNAYFNNGKSKLAIPVLNEGDQVLSDFSDSYFMIGAKQKLYNGWRGQMVLGLSFPDANSGLGQVFYNQVMVQLENKKNIIKIGRSTTQTILGQFSTIRDDDALLYNYVLNPFSNGLNTEDNQYANVIEYTRIIANRLYITVHGENYQDFEDPNDFAINGIGGSVIYRVPESQVWNRNFLSEIGFSSNNFIVNRTINNTTSDEVLKNLIGYAKINIKPDPVHFIDLKIQAIYNNGFSDISEISDYSTYTRSQSTAVFGMLRYLNRKLERPNFQISIGGGYKSFNELTNTPEQFLAIGNLFYRIGNNFDVLFQYRYTVNNGSLGELLGNSQQRVQVGLAYSFNKIFNNQFDDRNSILNLEHNYIK